MYLQHFGLKEFPFSITPDTSFFFSSGASQQALNTLLVATRAGEGFIKITGEVGAGKTLLCRHLLQSLGPDYQTAFIPNPYQTPLGLLLELADELSADTTALGAAAQMQHQHFLMKALGQRLLQLALEGKRVVVCLDEVQAMPIETLEALRLLTNLETEKRKLVQVVIFGQPELNDKLNHPSIRQLKQRITFEYHLGPLKGPELSRYLNHRMSVAGYDGPGMFSAPAQWLLNWRSRGYPRLVNVAAHKSLLCAFGRGKHSVSLHEMRQAINDSDSMRVRPHEYAFAWLTGLVLVGIGLTAVGVVQLL